MPVPFADPLDHPVLAVDIGSRTTRALLHVPGGRSGKKGVAARYAFALPSSERMHAPGAAPEDLCPSVGIPPSEAGFNRDLWCSLPGMIGLPQPEAILVSALECGGVFPSGSDGCQGARCRLGGQLWGLSRSGGIGVGSLVAAPLGKEMLRLRAIQRITGYPVLDSSAAFVLGLLAVPGIAERSYREGLTLLFAGGDSVSAGLVFQDRLLAFFELSADRVLPPDGGAPSLLLNCLEEFRLGWLPKERASQLGGWVDAVPALPPEAEGFRPLFVVGSRASLLEKHGRLIETPEDRGMNNCRGLLYGYARLREDTSASGL